MEQAYPGADPKGYGRSLFLSRIPKVKQTFVSDRVLPKRLSENAAYRSVCGFKKDQSPSHSTYACLVLDAAYGTEHIRRGIFAGYGVIPIIVRETPTYPKGFSKDDISLCPLGYKVIKAVDDYKRQRTKYICKKICKTKEQKLLQLSAALP